MSFFKYVLEFEQISHQHDDVPVKVLRVNICKKERILNKNLELDISEWKHLLTYTRKATPLFWLS